MAMHNRWFHKPHLHSPKPGNTKRVEWLELFYDLIYVAGFIQMGNALSEQPGFGGVLIFAALFVPIWSLWTSFTFYANRFIVDDFVHRLTVFVQMFAVGGMSICVGDVFDNAPHAFALCYAVARWTMVGLYARTWLHGAGASGLSRRNTIGFALGATLWTVSVFLPTPWIYVMWGVALIIDFWVPLNRRSRAVSLQYPPDVLHMSERYGLLTIIVLGESFVKVLSSAAEVGLTPAIAGMGALALLVTFSLWWIYFDDVAGSSIKKGVLNPFIWVYAHLPLTLGVTATGVAIKKAALMAPHAPGTDKYRYLLCGMLALVLLCVAAIDMVTERRVSEMQDRNRVNVRLISAGIVILLAPAGAFMPAYAFILLVTLVCVAQVIIDLSMAPMADPHEAHHMNPRLFGDDDDYEEEDAPNDALMASGFRRVRDSSSFVRRGTPSELRADLYFYLMEGSWKLMFVSLGLVFMMVNVVFAALFLLDPDPNGIQGMGVQSFAEAFYFSVQTFSTIGYGVLSPESDWANALVVVEAALGIVFMALITGLVFAKAARPRSSTLFSRPMVVQMRDGKPTLIFRVGNARGNEVVEASMRVTAAIDTTTAEGSSMRKLVDVKLVRDNSPLFTLSWTVMHIIDEESPFYGMSPDDMEAQLGALIVVMTGYDATYAQTTHSQYFYHPSDIRWNYRFVDVIAPLEDGTLSIDYRKFHSVEGVPAPLSMEGVSVLPTAAPPAEDDEHEDEGAGHH